MMSRILTRLPPALLAAVSLGSACSPQQRADAGPTASACSTKADCATGEVCSGGVCIQGECETREHCPHPRDQLCNEFFKCVPDPLSPIGTQCPNGDLDCHLGQFCSAGTCYSVEGRTSCLRSSQCAASERCDARSGYCVPNLGGCDRCSEYEELCCLTDESCDPETKRCRANGGGNQCTPATEATDCRTGEHCANGRCVQCTSDNDCGPGTVCNTASGRCVSSEVCNVDADCSAFPGRRCAVATHQCTVPQCESNADCSTRENCNLETFMCFLPPATCTEQDEPNNGTTEATALSVASATRRTGSGTLCRGDVDYLSFPVDSGKNARVTVTMTPGTVGAAEGITLALFGPSSSTALVTGDFGFNNSKTILGLMGASGTAFLKVDAISAGGADQWTYTVEVTLEDPPMCATEGGEPNETRAQASNSVLPLGPTTRALCTETDEDYHLFHAAAGKQVDFTISYSSSVYMDLELLDASGNVLDSAFFDTPPVTLTYRTNTAADLILHLSLFSGTTPTNYTVTVAQSDLPTCNDTAQEPNNTQGTAFLASPGDIQGVMCDHADLDYFSFTLLQPSQVRLELSFRTGVDLDMTLSNSAGTVASALSSAIPEIIDRTSLAIGQYWVKVESFTSTASAFPIPYTLRLTAPGSCQDDNLDTEPGNDVPSNAVGLRDMANGAFSYEADLALCRNDQDWFRVVALGTERLSALLTNLSGATVSVYASTANGPVEVARSRTVQLPGNTQGEWVSMPVSGGAGLFYVQVQGGVNTQGPYHLAVRADPDPCDGLSGDAEPNDTPHDAIAAGAGTNAGIFCPADDLDVWKVNLASGATVTAQANFDGSQGDIDLELWSVGQASPLVTDIREDSAPAAVASVNTTVASAGTYFVVVKRKATGAQVVGQAYSLTITSQGGSSSSSGAGSSSRPSSGSASSSGGGSSSASGPP